MSEKDDVEIVLLRSLYPSGSLTRSMRVRMVSFHQQSLPMMMEPTDMSEFSRSEKVAVVR